MKIRLTLPGSIRSKKNSKRVIMAVGRPRLIPSKAYLVWEKEAQKHIAYMLCFDEDPRRFPLKNSIHIEAHIYYKGQRPDLSGALESIGDCLEGIVWHDDRQIESWDGSRLYHDKKNPRTELIIRRFKET